MQLILASRSPRRQELLAQFDIPFSVQEADLDETPLPNESPEAMTKRLALAKARHVYQQQPSSVWVLGGDTTVALEDVALGKPVNREEAVQMLTALSDTNHVVVSAVALVGESFAECRVSATEVTFGPLSRHQIESYCNSGEPFDKAGGYGIQGFAGVYVKELRGSYSGVVGLPLFETRVLLEQAQLLNL
ncbi:MAG: Maf family protein [Acidiferrobacterales bacterium]|nr:Maf family protein [Acidiferrobacterales bacterium]